MSLNMYLMNSHSLEHKKELVLQALEGKCSTSLKQRLCEASSLFFDIKKYKNTPTVLLCDLNDKEFSLTIDALSNHKYHDDKNEENLVLHDASYQYTAEVYNPHPEAKEVQKKSDELFFRKGKCIRLHFYLKCILIKTMKIKLPRSLTILS